MSLLYIPLFTCAITMFIILGWVIWQGENYTSVIVREILRKHNRVKCFGRNPYGYGSWDMRFYCPSGRFKTDKVGDIVIDHFNNDLLDDDGSFLAHIDNWKAFEVIKIYLEGDESQYIILAPALGNSKYSRGEYIFATSKEFMNNIMRLVMIGM